MRIYMVWSVYGYTIFNEPKDRSDTRSVAFKKVESSDNEPKDGSDTEVWLSTKLKVLTVNRKDKSDSLFTSYILQSKMF